MWFGNPPSFCFNAQACSSISMFFFGLTASFTETWMMITQRGVMHKKVKEELSAPAVLIVLLNHL